MSQTQAQADQAATEDRTPSIERAGKHKWGYNIAEVDDFLDRTHAMYESETPVLTQEDIQVASFHLEKNGYVISQVDAALLRLERAIVDQRTQYTLTANGEEAWQEDLLALARTLQERAEAGAKQRFARGQHRLPSYDFRQVDQIVAQAWTHIADRIGIITSLEPAAGAQDITSQRVSNVIFTRHKGKHGYGEASVDAYLNRCVQVLTRMESYERVTGHPLQPFAGEGNLLTGAVAQSEAGQAPVRPTPTHQAAGQAAGKAASSAMPLMPISYDGPSAVAQEGETAPEAFSPIPQPLHESSQASGSSQTSSPSFGQDASQTQDTGWGSARLASLVSTDHSSSRQSQSSVDAARPEAEADATRVGAGIEPDATMVGGPSVVAHRQPEQAARPEDIPAAGPAPSAQARQTSPASAVQPAASVQSPQQVYTDLQAVPDEASSDTSSAHSGDESYISSLLNSSVSSTDSFEIPDLTFPAPRSHSGAQASSADHADQHDSGAQAAKAPSAGDSQE